MSHIPSPAQRECFMCLPLADGSSPLSFCLPCRSHAFPTAPFAQLLLGVTQATQQKPQSWLAVCPSWVHYSSANITCVLPPYSSAALCTVVLPFCPESVLRHCLQGETHTVPKPDHAWALSLVCVGKSWHAQRTVSGMEFRLLVCEACTRALSPCILF